jgi:hypothetical protein
MGWIVAAVRPEGGYLSPEAEAEFRQIASTYPAAPWKIETGHLRGGRERLEQITGRSWAEVDLPAEAVRQEFELLSANAALAERGGLTAALLAFLGVCARYGLSLEGGEGARAMRPAPIVERPI